MTVSEEDLRRYQQALEQMAPQMQMMATMWQPLENMLQEFFGKIGVTVKTNKMVYLRNRGELIYGIVFQGPQHILDQIAMTMSGKAVNVKEGEEEKINE